MITTKSKIVRFILVGGLGVASVLFLTAALLPLEPPFCNDSFIGEAAGDVAGLSVAGAGDVNGDGYDDFLIGAPYAYDVGTYSGEAYLILGGATGWGLDTSLSNADASFLGEAAGDFAGSSVAGAGDVNGDGLDDLLVGAPNADVGGEVAAGRAYLIFGQTTGWAMNTSLANADASFHGEASANAADAVAGAGDVNGDGYADFLVGAPGWDAGNGGMNSGKTYLILGGPSGWALNTALATNADASFEGEDHDDDSGSTVAGVGDVNGDGFDDFLIGSPDNGQACAGKVYLILGQASGWARDRDLADPSVPAATFLGESGKAGMAVAGAGDVNGDGFDDFLVGAPFYNDGGDADVGKTYLILGRAAADWGLNQDLGTVADASFIGVNANDRSGWSVAGSGDLNGDGYDDFLIGADGHQNERGRAYAVLGRPSGWVRNVNLVRVIFPAVTDMVGYTGESSGDHFGYSVAGVGDVNRDGFDDALVGAPFRNEGGLGADWGQSYLIPGAGQVLRKIAHAPSVPPGGLITYTVQYTNVTPFDVASMSIYDAVPAGTAYVACAGGASCSESGGTVTWDLDTVISATTGVVTLTVRVSDATSPGTVITNTAVLTNPTRLNPLPATVTTTVSLYNTYLPLMLRGWTGSQPQQRPEVAGCDVFPADNVWNTPVDTLPVDGNSDAYIATIGSDSHVHPDFGSGTWEGGPIGIPYVDVPGTQARVDVTFDYADESDDGPYPIPPDPPIEGGPSSTGDRHVLVVDRDNCVLYELFYAFPQPDGSWHARSGAIFDLNSNELRPVGWTSADAAGLPILPGLVRYDEVAEGEIRHALRFTAPQTRMEYIWPARHYASSFTGAQYPPMGQRFRLRAGFDISGFSPEVQVILQALKRYGMILADNGSAWYISGVPDERWDNDVLHELHQIHGSDFEAVDESSLIVDPDSGQAQSN